MTKDTSQALQKIRKEAVDKASLQMIAENSLGRRRSYVARYSSFQTWA